MTDGLVDKPFRSLFGGIAKQRKGEKMAVETAPMPAEDDRRTQVQNLNLKVIAAALALGDRAALHPATPILQPSESLSRSPWLKDLASPWFAYWARELQHPVRAQRGLWEQVAVLQAFYQAGVLIPGARAIGFGVGRESLPSYLASIGLSVIAADQPGLSDPDLTWRPELVARETFEERVEVSEVDIRRLDDSTLRGFDACWSSGVISQLTSLAQAEETLIAAMDVLRPGGVAVHIADFTFADGQPPVTPRALCFGRDFFETLANGLNGRGHKVAPVDFDLGYHPLDGYVDTEPYGETPFGARFDVPTLKMLDRGLLRTSFALIVTAR